MPQLKVLILKQSDSNRIATILTQAGKNSELQNGFVNPPIQRGSTILFNDANDLYDETLKSYGLEGSSTHDNLCDALNKIMGANASVLCPSGLSAITTTLLAFTKSGDHVLVSDSAYGPTRRFCDTILKSYGVNVDYYPPRIGKDISQYIRENTKIIMLESPGSLSLEIQDVPAIVEVAKAKNILTAIDDTWSAGIFFKPLLIGIDISIQALTKYQSGHSDVLLGSISTINDELHNKLVETHKILGLGTSAEDAWLCLRGLRTMAVRLKHQDMVARELANWLMARPEIEQIIHPALPNSPDYEIWARDFTGAGALFSIILKPEFRDKTIAMLNSYKVFSMGFSWGGYESLAINCNPQLRRNYLSPEFKNPLIRYSIGLEDIEDLKEDFIRGFDALK